MKPREIHFDVIKGIAICMVVMGHVLTMCIRQIDNLFLFKTIGEIHMPLFFFISGYFTCKVNETKQLRYPNLTDRAKQLLIPFFVVSALWLFYFPHSHLDSPLEATWEGLYFNIWKNGYWFTLCLFEIMLIYTITLPIINHSNSVFVKVSIYPLVWGVLVILWMLALPEKINNLIGTELIVQFFPIFIIGVYSHKYKVKCYKVISNGNIQTIAMLIFAAMLYYVCYSWEFSAINNNIVYLARIILHVSLAVIVVNLIKRLCENNPSKNIAIRYFSLLGKESLAIYLLHYFFLFPMGQIRQPLIEMGFGFVPALFISFVIATIIIITVLGVNYIIKQSRFASLALTGKIR